VASTHAVVAHLLSRSLADPAVSDADCRQVHALLERLPPAAYREVLARLEQDGLLARYAQEAGPEGRAALVRQGEAKGLYGRKDAKPTAQAPGAPPDAPRMYRNDRALPQTLQGLLHETNVGLAHAYQREYDAYVDRYVALVQEARSPADLVALGRPVHPCVLEDPSYGDFRPDARAHRDDFNARGGYAHLPNRAYEAISDRHNALLGRQTSGQLTAEAAVEVQTKGGPEGAKVGVVHERSVTVGSGRVSHGQKTELSAEAGPATTSVAVNEKGEVTQKTGVEADVRGMKVSVSVEQNGALEVQLQGGLGSKGGGAFIAVKSRVSPQEGTLQGAVKLGVEKDGRSASVSVGAGFQGGRPEAAQDVARGEGYARLPAELGSGARWQQLPPARREELARQQGWTQQTWDAEAARRASPARQEAPRA
jgi:hypothetical protein